jgi:hypothetical protein
MFAVCARQERMSNLGVASDMELRCLIAWLAERAFARRCRRRRRAVERARLGIPASMSRWPTLLDWPSPIRAATRHCRVIRPIEAAGAGRRSGQLSARAGKDSEPSGFPP